MRLNNRFVHFLCRSIQESYSETTHRVSRLIQAIKTFLEPLNPQYHLSATKPLYKVLIDIRRQNDGTSRERPLEHGEIDPSVSSRA